MKTLLSSLRQSAVSRTLFRRPTRFLIWIYYDVKAIYLRRRQREAPAPLEPKPAPQPQEVTTKDIFEEAAASSAIGIGNSAVGNLIVMLVVSDLRIDPRVEREARALVAAGYKVTVICPEPTQGQQPDLHIDWGENIDFELLHW